MIFSLESLIRALRPRPWARAVPVLILAAGMLGACADAKKVYRERPVEDLYNEAMDHLQNEEYKDAASEFEEVERQHPYSIWATKAQLMTAYSHYEANKYDDAVVALDRFIQLHPGNRDTPYAYYLKGLCYYEQITDVGRDQRVTELALKILQEVVDRFPASKYAPDARLKVDLARDHLAGKEMAIGRYYMKRGLYLAALNRFKVVTEQYQTTTQVPEALHRQVEAYVSMGLIDDAKRTAAVLGHNYPGSEWYEDSYSLLTTGRSASVPLPEPKSKSGWLSWW